MSNEKDTLVFMKPLPLAPEDTLVTRTVADAQWNEHLLACAIEGEASKDPEAILEIPYRARRELGFLIPGDGPEECVWAVAFSDVSSALRSLPRDSWTPTTERLARAFGV